MTFTNPTDFPDFTALDQLGGGVIYANGTWGPGTFGPFYVGNTGSIQLGIAPGSLGNTQVEFYNVPVLGGGPLQGINVYDHTGITNMWDEIKVAGSYLFLVTTVSGGGVQVLQSRGTRGVLSNTIHNNNLLNIFSLTLAAGAEAIYHPLTVIPGPATVTALAANGGVPLVRVLDYAGGTYNGVLGYGQGQASTHNNSGVTFECTLSNNPIEVDLFNVGGVSDNAMAVSVTSMRGY